jgi:hypothetical protein
MDRAGYQLCLPGGEKCSRHLLCGNSTAWKAIENNRRFYSPFLPFTNPEAATDCAGKAMCDITLR